LQREFQTIAMQNPAALTVDALLDRIKTACTKETSNLGPGRLAENNAVLQRCLAQDDVCLQGAEDPGLPTSGAARVAEVVPGFTTAVVHIIDEETMRFSPYVLPTTSNVAPYKAWSHLQRNMLSTEVRERMFYTGMVLTIITTFATLCSWRFTHCFYVPQTSRLGKPYLQVMMTRRPTLKGCVFFAFTAQPKASVLPSRDALCSDGCASVGWNATAECQQTFPGGCGDDSKGG
jgi:hypothetical protein